MAKSWKFGGCHCGAVAFEALLDDDVIVEDCNCSMCAASGFLHIIVPAARFRLLSSWDALATYTFNTRVAKHYFCKRCGVKSFYVPRSNPDGFSLNYRCMAPRQFLSVEVRAFDGRNWELNAGQLAHLSKE